jgi:hypothetical protein
MEETFSMILKRISFFFFIRELGQYLIVLRALKISTFIYSGVIKLADLF